MNTYETTATVEVHGQLLVVRVPFAPGTEVDVKISPKAGSAEEMNPSDDVVLNVARDRMRELFRTVKGFQNLPRIPREELYERGRLH